MYKGIDPIKICKPPELNNKRTVDIFFLWEDLLIHSTISHK